MDSLLLKSGWFIQNNNNEMVQYGGKIKEKLLHVTPVAVKGLYIEKNPAYGRHRISRPMETEAPIPIK